MAGEVARLALACCNSFTSWYNGHMNKTLLPFESCAIHSNRTTHGQESLALHSSHHATFEDASELRDSILNPLMCPMLEREITYQFPPTCATECNILTLRHFGTRRAHHIMTIYAERDNTYHLVGWLPYHKDA